MKKLDKTTFNESIVLSNEQMKSIFVAVQMHSIFSAAINIQPKDK